MSGRPVVVVHVLEALEGGTARHVVDITRFVTDVTHHVVVPPRRVGGSTDPDAVAAMEAAGAQVHRVDMRRNPISPRNAVAARQVRRLVTEVGPAIVHGHSAVGGALARTATAGLPVRRVYTPNGLYPPVPAMVVERALGTPALTDRLVAVSESEAVVVAARGLVSPDRLVVIPNGIDLDTTPPPPVDLRAAAGIGGAGPVVGFVGRLSAQKGPDLFVLTAELVHRSLPAARFVLVGSGPEEAKVSALIRERGLDGVVHLVPYLAGAAGVMSQLDVLVAPSRYEGGPYAPLEAMRAGTPVVVSDAVGNRDVVVDGVSGRLARTGDVAATAAAVVSVLTDPDERRRLTAAARARLAERFDVRRSAVALAELYTELAPPH